MEQVVALAKTELDAIALSAIIADAAAAGRDVGLRARWWLYESAKGDIARLDLPADEYERAIKMLAEALKI